MRITSLNFIHLTQMQLNRNLVHLAFVPLRQYVKLEHCNELKYNKDDDDAENHDKIIIIIIINASLILSVLSVGNIYSEYSCHSFSASGCDVLIPHPYFLYIYVLCN